MYGKRRNYMLVECDKHVFSDGCRVKSYFLFSFGINLIRLPSLGSFMGFSSTLPSGEMRMKRGKAFT